MAWMNADHLLPTYVLDFRTTRGTEIADTDAVGDGTVEELAETAGELVPV